MKSRLALLKQIIKMLLNIVPKTRNDRIKEPIEFYKAMEIDVEEFEFPF